MPYWRRGILLVVLFLVGCASGPTAPPAEDADAKTFVIPDDKAAIYVYRTKFDLLFTEMVQIEIDRGEKMAVVGPGEYVWFLVEPGDHEVLARGQQGFLTPVPVAVVVLAEAGEKQYVQLALNPGWGNDKVDLDLVPYNQGRTAIANSTLVQWFR
jgi:hypothetical protein